MGIVGLANCNAELLGNVASEVFDQAIDPAWAEN
jgi:hypothetical protein